MCYGVVDYVSEGPDGYRPKMLHVPLGHAIRAGAGGGYCEIYCELGHVGDNKGRGGGAWPLSALCSVE